MKLAADFRQAAREALRGKWPIAILIGLVAVLLGGAGSGGPEVKFNYDVSSGVSTTFGYGGQTIYSTGYGLAAAYFILGSIVGVGYAKYNLGLVDRTEPGFEALFAYLPNWKTTTLTRLWKGLYILLGTILLVIPGLIMGYTYAMTDYILAEHPDMAPGEVMKSSKAMMEGNRWRLFCLQFSFIGWMILSSLTFGLGNLALRPYQEAAYAAFYREVSLG